ncbi:MAG: tetratricopeptide repeat protein [Pirellulales bacterium]|nr:tetratricopeptide repeat protein [Pirellulales bacterium]
MRSARYRVVVLVLGVVVLSLGSYCRGGTAAEQGLADVPLADERIRELMQDGDYAGAIAAIDAATAAEDAPRDYLAYLKGRALFLQKKYDEAVAAFAELEKQSPEGPWVRRARFGRAVALARKGDFRAAEEIYRAEAVYLLSMDRKQEIADIYLEFADSYFKPPKDVEKPDYQKALDFYTKALAVGPKPEKQAEVELLVAQCQQQLGKLDEAVGLFTRFTKDHPDSKLDVEARFRLGECLLAQGKLKEARRAWQDLLAKHADDASERIAEAAFHLSRTWRIPEPAGDAELSLGVASLDAFLKRFPDHKQAGAAHLDVAKSYLHRGRHEDAVAVLKRFLADEKYRDREEAPDARNLLGLCYQLQKKFPEALGAWKEYLANHPAHKAWSQVQQEIVNTEYLMGQEAFASKRYEEARKLLAEFLSNYPLDGRGPRILLLFGQMNREEKKWDEAIGDYRRLVSKYPEINESSLAQFSIGSILEEQGKLEEALEEYRKVTWGDRVGAANQAVARLTAKSLSITTERVFRSDEKPKLKLTTRNIEKVTVRAFKIDLETYFRKMHLATGVERLDIALIDPDVTFEFTVPEYAKHREIESQIEVPLPAGLTSGAMAVTVNNETLEATTMLLQSDLDVIVKSSRDEVFVFAQNMLTGKPWPGVKLLVSDGGNVFAEAATGDNGVLQKSYKELKAAGDVRVFAMIDGHVTSNAVGLEGVGVARGLADKGYLYTDRPAYRAGQIVHVRGCVRQVAHDAYVIEEGKTYTLEAFDARNRLVEQQEVKLGKFGSFHAFFMLPPTSPQGEYRVLVRDKDQKTYQGTFLVHEYQLEPVRLVIDAPRTVYYRGEEIEGTIRAEYYYGVPLADAALFYRLADDRVYSVRTDAKGEVKFKLPTREYAETQVLPLLASLPERNVRTATNFLLACQGFSISLKTVRPVYVAGETFEVTLATRDAEGKPLGQKLELKVFERTTVEGKVGEKLVETHPIESDAKDGTARATLKLAGGGQYLLRAEGTDRFGNPISGQHIVQISDDKDEIRLRILADEHTYKVGDTARVTLHWREKPALALVTFQGARILDYKLVTLAEGDNALEIPMAAKLAPNFELAVAVMTDLRTEPAEKGKLVKRFHEASSPFTVQRDLRVAIATKRVGEGTGPIRPGDKVEVTITTTDPQGKPVPAEVGLAMVEQSLLERFSWSVGAIGDFFRGEPREAAVRTTSSITFTYRPETKTIDRLLLAEKDRLEVADAEELSRLAVLAPSSPAAAPALAEPPTSAATGGRRYLGTEVVEFSNAYGLAVPQLGASRGTRAKYSTAAGDKANRPGAVARWYFDAYDGKAAGFAKSERFGGLGVMVANGQPEDVRMILDGLAEGRQSQVVLLDKSGEMVNFNLFSNGVWDVNAAQQAIAGLAADGALLLPNLGPQETGYWNPSIVTDDQGKATVTLTVPDRSTAWKLLAKGITTDTLAGEATDALAVKKELFGQLKLPLAFTDGDQAQVQASIHNDVLAEGTIEVTLTTTIAGRSVEEKKTLTVKAKGIEEIVFPVKLERPAPAADDKATADVNVVFELAVAAGDRRDVLRQSVPLKPFGMPVYAIGAGAAESDTTVWLEPPAGASPQGLSLQILLGPTVEQSLGDILFGAAPACQLVSRRIASGVETATSDLLTAIALQKLPSGDAAGGSPQRQALDSRIRSTVGLLVSSQNDDGGWSWTGAGGDSNRYSTARAVWAASLARKAGYTVPDDCFNKALAYLQNQLTATANDDYETKAILLHAVSVAGHGDFALANRLHRNRPALSTAALAHLALAFVEINRPTMAAELLDELAKRNMDDPQARWKAAGACLPWNNSSAELRALAALAIQRVRPKDSKAEELVNWLLAHRTGHRWTPEKATGPAALALCQWFAESRHEGEKYQLTVLVNDAEAIKLDVDPTAGTQTLDVPAKLLKEGKQSVRFQLTGRGRYSYQCILGGFVPADKLANTTQDWWIKRTYQPAPLELDGLEIPRGFGVLEGNYQTFQNPITQLPVGRRGVVEVEIYRQHLPVNVLDEHLEYLVVTEPIPSGTTVIEKSVQGPFERFEVSPGAITFYIGTRRHVGTIRYELYGYLPGNYRAAPTVLCNAHRPDQMAVTQVKPLTVLPAGQTSGDQYRFTPQELYELGKRHFDKGDMKTARKHLADLVENWNPNAEVYKHGVTMLLDAHLALGPADRIVRYFEIIKEKWPTEQIPFDKIVKVADAYHQMNEFERSYLVFRATVESSFRRESAVAGFLEAQGEFTRSVDVMSRLLREYPGESYVAAATYALAQRVYAKAPEAAADAKLRRQKINRIDLVRQAWRMLEAFLTTHPEDPAADQAAFSTANALLELKKYEEAAAACNRYARRYPKSDLVDSFWYMIGYCDFAMGKHEAALEMCRKVAETKRTDPATGREVESPNKWQAIYILGQVHHSLGQAAEAIREYERVEDRFADAREAIDYFRRKAIELPEVTTLKPGQPGEVELKFRNVAACDAKVYRIDLMKFGLLKRNLGGITQINLAGIRPHHEAAVPLGDGKDYRDRTHRLALPLKDEGAYLVVCRGENLYASGLVLVTPLAVDVQEDAASGRVRTTVKDTTSDQYVNQVHVKVIGSRNDDFISGETDLRGIFIADGVHGKSTVIAQAKPGRYAFFRGQTELAPPPPPEPAKAEAAQPQAGPALQLPSQSVLLEGLQRANTTIQRKQVEQLQDTYKSGDQGVEAQKAF